MQKIIGILVFVCLAFSMFTAEAYPLKGRFYMRNKEFREAAQVAETAKAMYVIKRGTGFEYPSILITDPPGDILNPEKIVGFDFSKAIPSSEGWMFLPVNSDIYYPQNVELIILIKNAFCEHFKAKILACEIIGTTEGRHQELDYRNQFAGLLIRYVSDNKTLK